MEAHLVEAEEDPELGLQADGNAPRTEPVGEAERRPDEAPLPPALHSVGPRKKAARDDNAEGDASEAARRGGAISTLFALFSIDKVVIGRVA